MSVMQKVIFSDTGKYKKEKRVRSREKEHEQIARRAYRQGIKDALKELEDEKLSSSAHHEGQQEEIKSEARTKERTQRNFDNILARQDKILFKAKAIFPFDLFPDTLLIDTTKITIINKQFFATEYVTTIPLKDLSDVTVQTAIFLASLTIVYMPQSDSPGMLQPAKAIIRNLQPHDAMRAKNILKGILVANSEKMDISQISLEDLEQFIEQFGKTNE